MFVLRLVAASLYARPGKMPRPSKPGLMPRQPGRRVVKNVMMMKPLQMPLKLPPQLPLQLPLQPPVQIPMHLPPPSPRTKSALPQGVYVYINFNLLLLLLLMLILHFSNNEWRCLFVYCMRRMTDDARTTRSKSTNRGGKSTTPIHQ
jgi:hypothetical protein